MKNPETQTYQRTKAKATEEKRQRKKKTFQKAEQEPLKAEQS